MRDRLILIAATFTLICAVPATAQTPDGLTPAVEQDCNVLIGATPGLYGLCVAFCEAHDAGFLWPSGDPADLDVPNQNILRNYNTLKSESDLPMPCLQQEVDECPCWTANELLTVFPPVTNIDANLPHACRNATTSAALENLENYNNGETESSMIHLSVSSASGESNCVVVNNNYPGGPISSDIHFDVSEEVFLSQHCKALLAARAIARTSGGDAWDCFDP